MARNGKRLGFLPDWRILTYVILAFNLLMLIWIISAVTSANGTPEDCGSLDAQLCNDAESVGAGIAVVLLAVLWALGSIILGVIWLVTNRSKGRPCPVCGNTVKTGAVQCTSCNYDFRQAAAQPGYSQPVTPTFGS